MEQPQDHTYSHVESGSPGGNSEASVKTTKRRARQARLRRTYNDYKKLHPQGNLCQRCAGISWTDLLSGEAYDEDDKWDELKLFSVPETSQELSASSCPLCRLMSSDQMFGKDPSRTLSVYNVYRTVEYDTSHDRNGWKQYTPGLTLFVSPASQAEFRFADREYVLQDACPDTQGYVLRKLDPENIDYEVLRRWLRYCKGHHIACDHTYVSFIPGLKVIDCTTGKVIDAPEDSAFRYLALSYVWGSIQSSGIDQDEFPATICDAITVTVQLGYRYLWVDQYCINQLAGGHKQAQIQLMGRIYAESELVIIAAAGSSSEYGLPGVSVKAREAQRRIRLEKDVELIAMNVPDHILPKSTWAQRGWTYQEGYLATRRLVFTDKEVLYVCNQGAWQESVQRPAMENDGQYLTMANECFPRMGLSPHNSRKAVYRFLDNYSRRKLSYDSDILNACTGVLNRLVSHHFWGMVAPRVDVRRCNSLCLEWRSWNPGQRRQGFPSWSWVATAGPKMIPSCAWGDHNEGYVAYLRTTDGRWLFPEEQHENRSDPLPMNFGPTLRLRATLYTASLSTDTKHIYTEGHHKPMVVFQSTDRNRGEVEVFFKLWLDAELTESDLVNAIIAILVSGSTEHLTPFNMGPAFMILQAVGHHYKRIGITDYEDRCWVQEKKTGMIWMKDPDVMLSYDVCRGSEEFIYIE
ncbi:unnamed protein product [Alternaria burnsii]|nr:unnamed protein product [Alternaria burnsii]